MAIIHPTAIVDPRATLGEDVEVGPFAIVEADVTIGDRTRLGPHSYLMSGTSLGTDNEISYGVVLGGGAQHRAGADDTRLVIGSHNVIREGVTIHRASLSGGATQVGDHNYFMATSHLGHDVTVSNYVTLANVAMVGGHARIGDHAVIGGNSAIHQRVTIGEYAMIGGMSGANHDVPPYSMVHGVPAKLIGENSVGLQRAGFDAPDRALIRRALRRIWAGKLSITVAIEQLTAEYPDPPAHLQRLLDFALAMQAGRYGRQLEH